MRPRLRHRVKRLGLSAGFSNARTAAWFACDLFEGRHGGFEFFAAESPTFRWSVTFEAVDQRQQIASHLATVAIDAVDGVVQPDCEVAVLAVGTGFVEHALHAVFAGRFLRQRFAVVSQNLFDTGLFDQTVDVMDVARLSGVHASGSRLRPWYTDRRQHDKTFSDQNRRSGCGTVDGDRSNTTDQRATKDTERYVHGIVSR